MQVLLDILSILKQDKPGILIFWRPLSSKGGEKSVRASYKLAYTMSSRSIPCARMVAHVRDGQHPTQSVQDTMNEAQYKGEQIELFAVLLQTLFLF